MTWLQDSRQQSHIMAGPGTALPEGRLMHHLAGLGSASVLHVTGGHPDLLQLLIQV
jgi:hypothetical protein